MGRERKKKTMNEKIKENQPKAILSCPKCNGTNIKKRLAWWIGVGMAVIFYILSSLPLPPVIQGAASVGIFIAIAAVILDKNVCKACKHRWR